MNLSVIIPIYNSEHLIKSGIERIDKACSKLNQTYEIICCDDNSSDRSIDVLGEYAKKYDAVKVMTNEHNKGLGFTLRKMIDCAVGNHIIYCDCDLPFGDQVFERLISEAKEADIVVASRYLKINNKIPILRRLCSLGYYWACKILFNMPVRDIGSGAVLFKKDAIKQINLKSCGFAIHAEYFHKASMLQMIIKEIPLKTEIYQKGSFNIIKHGMGIICETLKLWMDFLKELQTQRLSLNWKY